MENLGNLSKNFGKLTLKEKDLTYELILIGDEDEEVGEEERRW